MNVRRGRTWLLSLGLLLVLGTGRPDLPRVNGQSNPSQLPHEPMARLAALERHLQQAVTELDSARVNEARMEAELEGLDETRGSVAQRLRTRTRSLYRVTRTGMLPLAGGFDSMLAHVVRVERLRRMVREDAHALRELFTRSSALRAEISRIGVAMEDARARISRIETEKRAVVDDARRAAVYAQAFGDPVPSVTDTRVSDPSLMSGEEVNHPPSFEEARGTLSLPIAAPRQVRPATREEAQGLELEGARGASVRAAAPGRVAFSDRHPAYGRLVIVDHGSGYFTVYGGLARIDAHTGDRVAAASNLGVVDGEPLFFQVRRGTRSLDASLWLGL